MNATPAALNRSRMGSRIRPSQRFNQLKHARTRSRMAQQGAAIVILAIGFAMPASGQTNTCVEEATLIELFKYSQLAERPDDVEADEDRSCNYGPNGETATSDELMPIKVEDDEVKNLDAQVKRGRDDDRAFVEGRTKAANVLNIGCSTWRTLGIDIAVELRLYSRPTGASDIVQTDVVGRTNDNDRGPGAWVPLEASGNVISLPGTNWEEIVTPGSNLFGKYCVFPAARFAVLKLCEWAYASLDDESITSVLTQGQSPTLVGHSLGAAAAQFIASSDPQTQRSLHCPGISAYAFGSIGVAEDTIGAQPDSDRLKSYLSECDGFAQAFGWRTQPGHLFLLSGPENESHYIDEIQADLCKTLDGVESYCVVEIGTADVAPRNSCLCPRNFRGFQGLMLQQSCLSAQP